ncbi:hypothetical protein STRAU_2116 [Streptomyces aurantiacus JA 4570]|uniref:Uncharacterized protein n=1 Tax=Streptomyces aurantiacus JA 4570 TaxID=1286094 RepID=S3ZMQ5_9ACTN|nr:hypothetical protein STRAU_2116 [Streptomyces aurantiacus JA 4570]
MDGCAEGRDRGHGLPFCFIGVHQGERQVSHGEGHRFAWITGAPDGAPERNPRPGPAVWENGLRQIP